MNRRNFGKLFVAAAGAAATGNIDADEVGARRPARRRLIKPPALRPGDVVGLIAPGGVVNEFNIERAVNNVESLGFKVKLGRNIRATRGGYAGSIAQRVDDLHDMFLDSEVNAIWAARGGSGCTGLLPWLRYDLIRRHSKILIGLSDITALHLAIHRHAGLVTFHGPVASTTLTDYSRSHLLAMLMSPQPQYAITMACIPAHQAESQPQFVPRTLRKGVAEGSLVGGNLSMICALIGTPYAAEMGKSLLFLEDLGEPPYRLDRMLTQLKQCRALKNAAGIMLGVFQESAVVDGEPSLTLDEVVDDHFAASPVPAVYGYSFGHISQQFPIPLGVKARLDTESRTLTLLEPAVRA